jgi:hypothetical protein
LTVTISANRITGNVSQGYDGGGGGIHIRHGQALIASNEIRHNWAEVDDGGGLYLMNTAGQVLDNEIRYNIAQDNGGGLYIVGESPVLVSRNWIEYNEAADDGGGAAVWSGDACLTNNAIGENAAGGNGNGAWVAGDITPCFHHNTLKANRPEGGAGLYISVRSPLTVTYTMANNVVTEHAVGIDCGESVTVACSVLSNTVDLMGSCIPSGCVFTDPHLIDQVHLRYDSPAIDLCPYAGVDDDIDGEPRPACMAYDAGADEFWYLAKVNRTHIISRTFPGFNLVLGFVRIVDQDDAPLGEATVDVEWTLPNGSTRFQTRTTIDSGWAWFVLWSAQSGTFEMRVLDVKREGYYYCPGDCVETCDTILVP